MASPQLENGYTRIANEILEQIVKRPFNERQISILFYVMRMTYGWQGQKMARISLTQFDRATGILPEHCSRTIKRLIHLKVLLAEAIPVGRKLGINKNYDQWGVLPRRAMPVGAMPAGATVALLIRARKGLPIEAMHIKEEEKKGKKEDPRLSQEDYHWYVEIWNSFAEKVGANKCYPWDRWTPGRQETLRIQIRTKDFEWEKILLQAYNSPFIREQLKEKKRWFDIDWVLKPGNRQKLMEGKYGYEPPKPVKEDPRGPFREAKYNPPTR